MQRKEINVHGACVSYLEWGKPKAGKATLVYLHGLIATAATVAELASALAGELHVLALDLPGAGYSERRHDLAARLPDLASLVRGFVDALGLQDVVLAGHSHGGAVSLRLAVESPERWRGLVLLSPAHPFSPHADGLIHFYLSAPGRAFAALLPWLPRRLHLVGFRQMAGPGSWSDPRQLVPYTANLRMRGTVAHLLRILAHWQADMAALATDLQAWALPTPTLLLWGDHDRAVPHATAAALQRHLLRSQLTVLPGVGHRPAEEAPGRCAELIRAWLDAQD